MRSNVELKARYPDHENARRILGNLGAGSGGVEKQVDTYFRVPEGRLKLREIEGSDSELIYYRRIESGSRRDCIYEISRHPDPSALKEVLGSALGVDVTVAKTREVYWFNGVKINLDDVEGLGRFIEFEAPADGEGLEAADGRVKELTSAFGIEKEHMIASSYSDMVRKS